MIHIGSLLEVAILCLDCGKPMRRQTRIHANSIPTEGDFLCVMCDTEECTSRYFTHTVEKKTGMVMWTDARYMRDDSVEFGWKPIYPAMVDKNGELIDMRPKKKGTT